MRLFSLALLLAAPLASAQQSDVFVQQAERALGTSASELAGTTDAGAALSMAVLEAGADANVATVSQSGVGNTVGLRQIGSGNQFGLVAVGTGNNVDLVQLGSDNVFLADIVGNGNEVGFRFFGLPIPSLQAGDGNRYELFLDGVDNQSHSVLQFGDGNSATQIVGPGMEPVSVEQSGGATVVIERR